MEEFLNCEVPTVNLYCDSWLLEQFLGCFCSTYCVLCISVVAELILLTIFIASLIGHRGLIDSDVLLSITSGIAIKCSNWYFRRCFCSNTILEGFCLKNISIVSIGVDLYELFFLFTYLWFNFRKICSV